MLNSMSDPFRVVRDIPAWGVLKWKVTPLQSFEGRADKERGIVEATPPTPAAREATLPMIRLTSSSASAIKAASDIWAAQEAIL
jgi:hypothetical protein